jgi:muramoyltetrapeptide carboxypeptidase
MPPPDPLSTRREVLRALGASALALPLAGCGPGWEFLRGSPPDAPPVPVVTPPPVEKPVLEPVEVVPEEVQPEPVVEPAPPAVVTPRELVRPRRLREGATVGLIAPAGVLRSTGQLNDSVRALQRLGFRTKVGRHVMARYGFLAGTDRERAEDLMAMVTDPDVDAIVCVRGGWGCARILPMLDYDLIRQHAKPIVGYSDVTALLLAVYERSRLISFHGPVGISTWPGTTAASFLQVLQRGQALSLSAGSDGGRRPDTIASGIAEGPFVGGNLSVIAGLAGTGYLPDFDGHVVFFEEVGEDSYRLDRLLTQLELAGVLRDPAAVVFGQCSQCSAGGSSWSAADVFRDHFVRYGVPAWTGAPIGHVAPVYTLPIGQRVATDAQAGTLEFIGAAVE